jgi:hypothetical protein
VCSSDLANLQRVSHHARVFELSAKTDQGMAEWCEYLVRQCVDSKRK